MAYPGVFLGALASVVVGAVMYWVVTYQGNDLGFSTIGLIWLIIGAVDLGATAVAFVISRKWEYVSRHSLDRRVTVIHHARGSFRDDAR